jgi:hypothetical protein
MTDTEPFLAFDKDDLDGNKQLVTAYTPDIAQEVDARLNWFQDGGLEVLADRHRLAEASASLREVLFFLIGGNPVTKAEFLPILRRLFALVWMVRPELLRGPSGEYLTLDALGKLTGVTRCRMSGIAAQFSRPYNFQARLQKRVTTRQKCAVTRHKQEVEKARQRLQTSSAPKLLPKKHKKIRKKARKKALTSRNTPHIRKSTGSGIGPGLRRRARNLHKSAGN